jgi:hypothetical protein
MTTEAIDRELGKKFRVLPPRESLAVIFVKITGKSFSSYWTSSTRTDAADILSRLFEKPGQWSPRLELFTTPNGGSQAQACARIFELRQSLERFGLSIACCVDWSMGAGARHKPYYRLVWQDEVLRSPGGRIIFYSIGSKRWQKKPVPLVASKPQSIQREENAASEQRPLF